MEQELEQQKIPELPGTRTMEQRNFWNKAEQEQRNNENFGTAWNWNNGTTEILEQPGTTEQLFRKILEQGHHCLGAYYLFVRYKYINNFSITLLLTQVKLKNFHIQKHKKFSLYFFGKPYLHFTYYLSVSSCGHRGAKRCFESRSS